jgi:hypothetical protein
MEGNYALGGPSHLKIVCTVSRTGLNRLLTLLLLNVCVAYLG